MYIPFNEVSLHNDFITSMNEYEKNKAIENFVKLFRELKRSEILDSFITKDEALESFLTLVTTDSLPTHLKQALLVSSKYFSQIKPDNSLDEFEILVGNSKYFSLGCSYASRNDFNKLVVSFRSNTLWESSLLNGEYVVLDIDGNENREAICLQQISLDSEIDTLKSYAHEKRRKGISSGQDLWEQREVLYPNLVFCENVKKQLYDTPQMVHIEIIMDKLDVLQSYIVNNENFSLMGLQREGIDISPESDTVEKSEWLRNQRKFKLPNGEYRFFTYHIKFNTPSISPCRIYIYPDSGKYYVGYIGKHLPTAKY